MEKAVHMKYSYDSGTTEQRPSEKPNLEAVNQALSTRQSNMVPGVVYYGLSDLSALEIKRFEATLNAMSVDERQHLFAELSDASESNFELSYRSLGFWGLNDPDAKVREAAIDLLWEDESIELMSRLIEVCQWDESPEVRAAAVRELGRFILLGEYEEISEAETARAQDAAISVLHNGDEEISVRRRGLEAISNSSHEIVPASIHEAYESGDHLMLVSAIFAMGRSYDKRWCDIIMKEIRSSDPEIVYEATRSAGELEMIEAVPILGQLAVGPDRDVQLVAIWSLGEIGGQEALRILSALAEDLEDSEDEDVIEAVEDAISNGAMMGGLFDEDEIGD